MKTKIEILGIKYYLGMGFLNRLISHEGMKLNELGNLDDLVLMPMLIFHSRAYACERLGLPIDFTKDDIYDYIDENGGIAGKFCSEFLTAYQIAMTQDVPIDDKKKVTKTKK